jgi:protocatechuate 3,4-dioxygenase beta subunit
MRVGLAGKFIAIVLLAACFSTVSAAARGAPAPGGAVACAPTRPDALGPFYKPGAPLRAAVGRGHVLRGVIRSAADCAAIAGARVEYWLVNPTGRYDDEHRGYVVSGREGAYRIETNMPPAYQGRPPHIHLRASADRHETLVTQFYPRPNQSDGAFDLVLVSIR